MKLPKVVLGDIVHLEFLDHCYRQGVDAEGPIKCEVFGRVVRITPKWFTIASWQEVGVLDGNTESFLILRSTLLKVAVLK